MWACWDVKVSEACSIAVDVECDTCTPIAGLEILHIMAYIVSILVHVSGWKRGQVAYDVTPCT